MTKSPMSSPRWLAATLIAVLPLAACGAPPSAPKSATAAAATPATAAAPAAATGALVAGEDYVEIRDPQPFAPLAGKIEVVEVFGYTCPHCAHFEPQIEAWAAKQKADVRFTPVAAAFGGYWQPYARAFFAADSLGLTKKTHLAVFNALHSTQELPIQNASDTEIAQFYGKFGVQPATFAKTMGSPQVAAKLKQSVDFATRTGVEGTPTMVINGQYRVQGRSFDDMLRIADALIAKERAKAPAAAKAP